jgi:hypothetical protein
MAIKAEDVRMKIWTGLSIVAALFVVFPAEVSAADWVWVGETDSGNATYVDRSSIKSTGSIRRYWTRADYVNDPDDWKSDKTLLESNCATGQYRFLQVTIYMVDGTNESHSYPSDPWEYVVPDTLGGTAHDYVCAL